MYPVNYKRTFYVAGMMLCVACGNSKKQQQQQAAMMGKMKPTVVAVEVTPASYTVAEKFPATLVAHDVVSLRPDVTGYLEAIRVPDGSSVNKG